MESLAGYGSVRKSPLHRDKDDLEDQKSNFLRLRSDSDVSAGSKHSSRTTRNRILWFTLLVIVSLASVGFFVSSRQGNNESKRPAAAENITNLRPVTDRFKPVFYQPQVLVSKNGVLEHQLTVKVGNVKYRNGFSMNVRTFDGSVPGPTFVVNRGDKFLLNVVNELGSELDEKGNNVTNSIRLPNSTNIHVHGLHVSPEGNSDNIFTIVHPAESNVFEYKIPDNHPIGTFYVHAHVHGSGAFQSAFSMHASLIVAPSDGDDFENVFAGDFVAMVSFVDIGSGARTDMLEDARLSGSEMDLNLSYPIWPPPSSIQFLTVNGKLNPVLEVYEGDWIRLRFINTVIDGMLYISFPSNSSTAYEIAADGVAFSNVRPTFTDDGLQKGILIPPGSRRDVAVQFREDMQVVSGTVNSSYYRNVEEYIGKDTHVRSGNLIDVKVRKAKKTGTSRANTAKIFRLNPDHGGYPPEPLGDLRDVKVSNRKQINFTEGGDNTPKVIRKGDRYTFYGFDGMAYSNKSAMKVHLNEVVEWTLVARHKMDGSMASESHPFHIHTNHFQVIDFNSEAEGKVSPDFQVGDWRDTIVVPAPGNVTIRWVPRDFSGRSVLHCHTLMHEDTGMMMNVDILP